jgi:hypothetical protein
MIRRHIQALLFNAALPPTEKLARTFQTLFTKQSGNEQLSCYCLSFAFACLVIAAACLSLPS